VLQNGQEEIGGDSQGERKSIFGVLIQRFSCWHVEFQSRTSVLGVRSAYIIFIYFSVRWPGMLFSIRTVGDWLADAGDGHGIIRSLPCR
jgi:hypothetical protein